MTTAAILATVWSIHGAQITLGLVGLFIILMLVNKKRSDK